MQNQFAWSPPSPNPSFFRIDYSEIHHSCTQTGIRDKCIHVKNQNQLNMNSVIHPTETDTYRQTEAPAGRTGFTCRFLRWQIKSWTEEALKYGLTSQAATARRGGGCWWTFAHLCSISPLYLVQVLQHTKRIIHASENSAVSYPSTSLALMSQRHSMQPDMNAAVRFYHRSRFSVLEKPGSLRSFQ